MRKLTSNRLKAHLAMAAFVFVTFAATGLTAAGAANYLALNLGWGTPLSQLTVQSASSALGSLLTSVGPQQITRGAN